MANIGDNLINSLYTAKSPIPKEILTLAYDTERQYDDEPISSVIYRDTYVEGFLKDIQLLVGGEEVKIDVSDLPIVPIGNTPYSKLVIPKSRSFGREITEALQLSFGLPPIMNGTGMNGTNYLNPVITQGSVNPLLFAANNQLAAHEMVPAIGTSKLRVIGNNVIRIGELIPFTTNMILLCQVAYTEKLQEINSKSFMTLWKAFLTLVQSRIYNLMAIRLDEGQLRYGQSLGKIKDIIDKYEDASEKYMELLNTEVKQVCHWNDPEKKRMMIENAIGGVIR